MRRTCSLVVGMAALMALTAVAQIRDPLTPAEADQIRNTAGNLDKRVPLLLHFAQERLARFEQIRTASPRPPDRAARLYAQLRQYKAILPEMDDAVDDLASGEITSESSHPKYNVPKVLTPVVTALQQMQADLQRLQKESSPADLATFHFEL
ncbi:MAG: hypothetical protein ACRD2D_05405, partial [Terriglobales bacterium]